MSGHFLLMVLMVPYVHSSSSQHPNIQSHIVAFYYEYLQWTALLSLHFSLSSLFQNQFGFSPGSSYQGNPSERGPSSGDISSVVWSGGYVWETKTLAPALSRVISIPSKPFLLIGLLHGWGCTQRPQWGMAWWGLALFKSEFRQGRGHHSRPANGQPTRATFLIKDFQCLSNPLPHSSSNPRRQHLRRFPASLSAATPLFYSTNVQTNGNICLCSLRMEPYDMGELRNLKV